MFILKESEVLWITMLQIRRERNNSLLLMKWRRLQIKEIVRVLYRICWISKWILLWRIINKSSFVTLSFNISLVVLFYNIQLLRFILNLSFFLNLLTTDSIIWRFFISVSLLKNWMVNFRLTHLHCSCWWLSTDFDSWIRLFL